MPPQDASPEPAQDGFDAPHPHINPKPPPLESALQAEIWQQVNTLRSLGIANYIELPQLVVVGDQSSGKSSVLEALTELPFPRDAGLCTRFATQVTFRRTGSGKAESSSEPAESIVTVSIDPADDGQGTVSEEKRNRVAEFNRKIVLKADENLTSDMFSQWFSEASKVMGIPRPGEKYDSNVHVGSFSSDTLSIDIAGPDKQNLTVTDLPGLIKTTTANQTEDDIKQIEKLTVDKIKCPKSIVLCVLAANVDVANQSVLDHAQRCDSKGKRTLAVLTKPDLVDEGGEHEVIRTARNEVKRLELGYFVVRNRGARDLKDKTSIEQRHAAEKTFFKDSYPWNTLDEDRVGIENLRKYLSNLQFQQFRDELPRIIRSIEEYHDACKRDLSKLGEARDTEGSQRVFLSNVNDRAKDLVRRALTGVIELEAKDPASIPKDLKLHIHMKELFEDISKNMAKYGNTRPFLGKNMELETEEGPGGKACKGDVQPLANPSPQETLSWIDDAVTSSIPFGICSSYNSQTVRRLFQQMSGNWEAVAEFELKQAKAFIYNFNLAVIEYLLPENLHKHSNVMLTRRLKSELQRLFKKAEEEMRNLLEDERDSVALITQSDYYHTLAMQLKNERVQHMLNRCLTPHKNATSGQSARGRRESRKSAATPSPGKPRGLFGGLPTPEPTTPPQSNDNESTQFQFNFGATPQGNGTHVRSRSRSEQSSQQSAGPGAGSFTVHIEDEDDNLDAEDSALQTESIIKQFQASLMDNEKRDVVLEIHDTLKAYYRIARKRFVDNFIIQVIERWLLRPLKDIYGPVWYSNLNSKELKEFAGEDPSTAAKRTRLRTQLERLEAAKEYLEERPRDSPDV